MRTTKSNAKKITVSKTNIPITIISGFLGSGKTTLLNHILTNQKGIKTAVLVNEFGEIGIDNELIIKTEEEMIELNNGCICCSINGELVEAIEKLINANNSLDYIIIESNLVLSLNSLPSIVIATGSGSANPVVSIIM